MRVRQSSPRRNHQSLPSPGLSTSLPKLYLQPITNPIFSGTRISNSPPNSFHRSHQYIISSPPSPSIRLAKSPIPTENNFLQTEMRQQNYKYSNSKYPIKVANELFFDNGKSYTPSFILSNYRYYLTPTEEKEIKKYTEIFYLRRKPKNKKLNHQSNKNSLSNTQDSNSKLFNDNENSILSNENKKKSNLKMKLNFDINEDDNNCGICSTIKSKIKEDFCNNLLPNDESNGINDIEEDEFIAGDHVAYRYEILTRLGSGAFGIVLKCFDHKMNHEVALKMIKETHENHPEIVLESKFLKNLQSGCKLHHIIEFYESFTFRNYFCISMELINVCNEQDINFSNYNDKRIQSHFTNSDLIQLFDAVNFIHSNGIMHCDLKPSNILFDIESKSQFKSPNSINNSKNVRSRDTLNSHKGNRNNRNFKKNLKIIDFGCSCFLGQCPYRKIQSLNYRSPEVIFRLMPYTAAIDIWSIGCIIYEVAVGCPLFNSNKELELINEIIELIGEPPSWMIEQSCRKSKFFIETNGQLKIKLMTDSKQDTIKNKIFNKYKNKYVNNDDLIKNSNDYDNNKSPPQIFIHSSDCLHNNNNDLIKNCIDFNKTEFPIYSNESNNNSKENVIKVCLPSYKSTTVRKNKITKKSTNLLNLRSKISSIGNPHLISLLEGCLKWDPNERMTAEQLLDHPFSRNIK